jgi:hypothetical protein
MFRLEKVGLDRNTKDARSWFTQKGGLCVKGRVQNKINKNKTGAVDRFFFTAPPPSAIGVQRTQGQI